MNDATIQLPPEQFSKPDRPVYTRGDPNHREPRNMKPIDPRKLPPEVIGNMQVKRLVSRNSKCVCGSGKRFKRCCGKGVGL